MIATIARKELTEMLRDGRFRAAAAIVLLLLAAAVAAGWMHYGDVHAQHLQAQQETRDQWLNQGEKNPHSAAHYGVYAFRPVTRLSVLDTGVSPYTGVAVWLEAHVQNEMQYRPAQDATTVQRFGDLTASVVLQMLIPLLIVLLAFSAFAGERDQGTLRQLLSLGVDRRKLAAGKALGIGCALALVLVPAAALGALALAGTAEDGVLAAGGGRTLLMALGYLAYFAIFLAVALGVSAAAPSARSALVILLAFWAVNALFAARAMADIAGLVHPTPSAVAFSSAMAAELNDQSAVEARVAARREQLLREHGVSDLSEVHIGFAGIELQESENHGNEVFDAHYGRLFELYRRQHAIEQLGAVFAPLIAIRSLSMGLAGTDLAHHRHFTGAAEEYRREIQVIMNDDILHNAAHATGAYIAGPELWAQVPEFEYRTPGLAWVLGQQRISVAALSGWLVLALGFAFVTTTRIRAE